MVTRTHHFRHADVKRALRAAEAAGVKDPTCTVHLPNGTTMVIGGAGNKVGAATPVKSKRSSRPAR
jgi:hypothetical protein